MTRRAIIAAVVLACASANASTVAHLEPTALEAGADRIVDAEVIACSVVWNADHSGLETHATLAVTATHKGTASSAIEIVVPGGELDGMRHVIVGMPAVVLHERARWFLRARGDGSHRVFGWAQGKWPVRLVDGRARYEPAPLAAERDPAREFSTNGMVWPAAKLPVPYLIQNAGSADLALPDEIAAFDAAFATWQAVPTASLTFTNAGMTNLGLAVDDKNVMMFIESGWQFGFEAAAATSLFIMDGMQTADIAVNGQNFTWAIGPPGSGITTNLLDLQGVLTHEIGHFSGLGHSMRGYDTMYFSWKPWQGQRTLSIDDKLGLSSVYPVAGNECGSCPAEEQCVQHPLGMLCEGVPDPVGAICSYDRVECDSFCLFTKTNLSAGYCSKFCESDPDCPRSHHCDVAAAGGSMVKVCFIGPQAACVDDNCAAGEHCDTATNACTFECRVSEDCGADLACDARGFCVADDDGSCSTGRAPVIGVLFVMMFVLRRRRATCR